MRLSALLVLPLAGCYLYFGPDDPAAGDQLIGDPKKDPPVPDEGKDPAGCGSPEVHVIGVYETSSDHSTVGQARVAIERPGTHTLVLSSYEATSWDLRVGDRAKISAIHLVGYEDQTVNLQGVPVTHDRGCGYSYPYNGQGCDTNALFATVKARTGSDVTTFHGCYQASQWTLHADGTASSNCNTSAGYKVDELRADCLGGAPPAWEKSDFATLARPSCTGDRFVRHDKRYNAWVGAILCGSSNRYKLYMSGVRNEPFLEIADFGGHGQDHCELVNPAFKLPNEDDITSGGCTGCAVGDLVDVDGPMVYARSRFGQPFERVQSRFWADLTTTFYSCGVPIPGRAR